MRALHGEIAEVLGCNVPLIEAWANAGEKSPVEVGAWLEALAEAREASCEPRTCREKRCGCMIRRVSPVMLRTRSFQAPESPLSNQHTAQPSEHELSCDKFTEIVGGCRGAHGSAEMAITDNFVQLIVGQFEEPHCFAVTVIFQSGSAQDRIFERHRDG